MPDKFALTEKEIETLHNFQVDFNLSALQHGVIESRTHSEHHGS
jgi:hypothetical protein